MEANITGSDDEQGIGVEVYDENHNRHWVVVMWDGSVRGHETDDYPHAREDRTLEEQRIMTQVEERAKLAAQREFREEDIVEPESMPEHVERAINAMQTMPLDRFAEEFETCYRMVTDHESVVDVSSEAAQMIIQPFLLDDNNEITYVPRPLLQYKPPGSDQAEVTERDRRFEELVDRDDLTKFTILLPPLAFDEGSYEFPDGFQVFLIEHLGAQMRDLHRHYGEEPPEPYADIDLPGRPVTAADDEYYEDFQA